MRRRTIDSSDQGGGGRSSAAEPVVCRTDAPLGTGCEDERQLRRALAEYFAILREWSLNARPGDAVTDSSTTQP
jgi:hypothetical protein